ncbi:MAG: alpha-L-arabinofuranosidase C-terminal domain-containing protein [Acidobacteriaceae bacterium]
MRFHGLIASGVVLTGLVGAGLAGGVAGAQMHHEAGMHEGMHEGGMQPVAHLDIDTGTVARQASPKMYGLMTEEINHAYEGGLYAELISNNTFRGDWLNVREWAVVVKGDALATAELDKTDGPSAALPTSMELKVASASERNEAGLSNPGYWGIAVRAHTTYKGAFYAKVDGDMGPLTARLVSNDTGAVLAQAKVAVSGAAWTRYAFELKTGEVKTSGANHFELLVAQPGTLHVQLVTLFPPTFDDAANGNRADLMEKMEAMHPNFIRLPGGNYLEGDRLKDWYNWKETVGPLVDRPGHMAPWTYWSTDGFGLMEFLKWTEELHTEPILAVYAGYSLRGEHVKPGKDLEPYVQSAVDEVEYLTGDVSTKWGAERAKDGHAAPFPLHYIEIGNEDFFDKSGSYDERFAQFAEALRKKYPQYELIATTPVKEKEGAEPDLVDDHYYKSTADMFDLVHHYDEAPRTGPKVFVGEWATVSASPTPDFGDALGDAAFMTSMERNSDLIKIASYAPLLVNVNPQASQWPTNLIGYDAVESYGSPSYYAQCMFAGAMGDEIPESSLAGVDKDARFFYSVTVSTKEHVLHLKLVNATTEAQPMVIALRGLGAGAHEAKVVSLHGATFAATNTIASPLMIHPVEGVVRFAGETMRHTVPALTIEVVDVVLK